MVVKNKARPMVNLIGNQTNIAFIQGFKGFKEAID